MAKRWRPSNRIRGCAVLLAAALTACAGAAAQSVIDGDTWIDSRTGLAIGGYDPVAYFVANEPLPGHRAHELQLGGRAWQFDNAANRAVFRRDPEVYAPQFGGHDPTRLAEGFLAPGDPLQWIIIDDHLYLFVSSETRQRWILAEAGRREQALDNWNRIFRSPFPAAPASGGRSSAAAEAAGPHPTPGIRD